MPADPAGSGSTGRAVPEHPDARRLAVDPTRNVVLEASAGTGKTSVLVARYLNLLGAGVDPANILAITFTRKAAVEMRERILGQLRRATETSDDARRQWAALRDRLGDVAITTIDAFCLSLLREFPLEADLDPGFGIADETEAPRLMAQALDRAQRVFGGLVPKDEGVALLLAGIGTVNLRAGLVRLLQRRLVAPAALQRFLTLGRSDVTLEGSAGDAVDRLRGLLDSVPGGLDEFLADGPTGHPRFRMLADDLRRFETGHDLGAAGTRSVLDRLAEHLLTRAGTPRRRLGYARSEHPSAAARARHLEGVRHLAPRFAEIATAYRRGVSAILARAVWRVYRIAEREYRRTLRSHAVLDFADVQRRALGLLRQMDEFAQSRYRLESRYHHVLVDEFQDTSRAQWELVSLLVQSWGEGVGLVQDAPLPPSIFVVGDRKQSIYRFRDADVSLFGAAAEDIARLRPAQPVRMTISRSFRAEPDLLRFVNDFCGSIEQAPARADRFRFDASDRFPLERVEDGPPDAASGGPRLGLAVADGEAGCAVAVAAEIDRLLAGATVRDPRTGERRTARPDDVAILFRSRASHQEYERALAARGVPAYVYKGLGFFGADEILDLRALLRFLADPTSDLWAAALLRSGFIRLSDAALRWLAPAIAEALTDRAAPASNDRLSASDRCQLDLARTGVARWLALVDRIPPAELIDRILVESAYAFETRGRRARQAGENLKKMRSLVRRIQNRGYVTLARLADHVERLSAGDESNAAIDAAGAVHLMTMHAAKGLEFPIVFVVGLSRGVGGVPPPIQVVPDRGDGLPEVAIGGSVVDVDDEERARELEETKRLLYVALTRARDALYLGILRVGGRVAVAHGSVAEVLPQSFVDWLVAAPPAGVVEWTAAQGSGHRFRVCEELEPLGADAVAGEPSVLDGPASDDDFGPWPG